VNTSSRLKSALVVVGGGLAASPATALELGDVKVHSTLGQPLRASIAYALGPNEAVSDTCVSLQPMMGAGGVPSIDRASLLVTDGVIAITGSSIVREPLVSMRVSIRCQYTSRLTRDYMMFIDPVNATVIEAPTPERVATQPQLDAQPIIRRTPVAERPRSVIREPIAEATVPAVADPVVPAVDSAVYEPVYIAADTAPAETETQSSESPHAELQPGDLVIDANNPYVAPVRSTSTETVVIPDTQLEGPQTTSTSPNVPVAIIRQATPSETSSAKWLWWLGGGGAAIILALVLFARRFRDGFASSPIAPAAPQRRETDGDTQNLAAIGGIEVKIAEEPMPTESLAIDADLIVGTGLQQGTEVDVAQDFGFAATTELDLELPEESSSGGADSNTDILPPLPTDEPSILESEVMPEDADYDMSVLVDATKMPRPEDVTERDLEAIQVPDNDETLITGDYTVSNEVDYKVLEQDYADEMTATQALNEEILKVAEDLAVSLDEAVGGDDKTSDMPLATVHELDVTSQMPVQDQIEIGDDDDTGINPTINMEADNDTIEMPKDGKKTG
jgi:hypothetical protein